MAGRLHRIRRYINSLVLLYICAVADECAPNCCFNCSKYLILADQSLLDLSPSTVSMSLLARGFTIFFGRRKCLGPDDMIIVRSELSRVEAPSMLSKTIASAKQGKEERDIVAKICHSSSRLASAPGDTEIYMSSGTLCETHTLPGGSYEILHHSRKGVQTMRWALRHSKKLRSSKSAHRENASPLLTFSIIDPGTRRHAVIASMTKEHIEVSQEYCPVDTEKPCSVDDELRAIILVTGLWVALHEKWA